MAHIKSVYHIQFSMHTSSKIGLWDDFFQELAVTTAYAYYVQCPSIGPDLLAYADQAINRHGINFQLIKWLSYFT